MKVLTDIVICKVWSLTIATCAYLVDNTCAKPNNNSFKAARSRVGFYRHCVVGVRIYYHAIRHVNMVYTDTQSILLS